MVHQHLTKSICNRHLPRFIARQMNLTAVQRFSTTSSVVREEHDAAETKPFFSPRLSPEVARMKPFVSPKQAAALAAVELKREQYLKKSKWTKTRQTRREVPKLTPKMIASYPNVSFRIRRIRGSWKKVMPITKFIIGMSAREASDQLGVLPHKYARVMRAFLKSSMLNCENVHGMNADRLLITECSVGRGKMVPRLRIHARGRHGLQHKQFSNVRMKLVEVPLIEGERKLGRWGWNNKTWESYHEIAEELPSLFPHLFESSKEESEDADATATATTTTTTYSDPTAEVEELNKMTDADLEKHLKTAMASTRNRKYTEEEIAEAERYLKEASAADGVPTEQEADVVEVTEKEETEKEETSTEVPEETTENANQKKQE